MILLPQRAMFRPVHRQLVISDLHLGKSTHFRKMGLAMPAESHLRDFDMLSFLLRRFNPTSVMLLGDLFHSRYNSEWLWLRSMILEHPEINFILAEGNHDILPESKYDIPNLFRASMIEEDHFTFTHHPLNTLPRLNICGHIHPGILLEGIAKQRVRLPCFYDDGTHFILPAFGNLTGLHLIEPAPGTRCFVISGNRVEKLK